MEEGCQFCGSKNFEYIGISGKCNICEDPSIYKEKCHHCGSNEVDSVDDNGYCNMCPSEEIKLAALAKA